MFYLYRSQMRLKTEYCCYIWCTFSQFLLAHHDRVEKHLHSLVDDGFFSTLQPLPHRWNITSLSLFNPHFHGKCSDKWHSLVPRVQNFTAKINQATSTKLNHPHSLHILLVRRKFHTDGFFPKADGLWNRHSRGASKITIILTSSSKINHYLSYIYS